ncbi:MAG: pyridoxal phosphate-dependent aminotransferase [Clostridiaceae bacterium]|nr:pyridoxal phosphate-dependent aminotransferase [Clostridiaceae bacterium]
MKHKFIAKRYWKDKSTPMGQSDVLAREYDDIINFSLGDPDLITDEVIIDNAFKDAKAGHTKYTDFRGDPELRDEIRKFYKDKYGMDFSDNEVMVVASGCLGMYLSLEATIDDGDEVIIHAPYFTPYPQQIELAGGVPVVLDTYEEEGFQINVGRLEKLINERTKAIVVNTPNNPSGSCFTMETLINIVNIARKHDLLIIADDIYDALSFENPFIPIASIDGAKERTIIINSFSKDYIMTGWRVGNINAPEYIIKTIQQINENVVFTAPSISQRGALYALRNRDAIQKPMVEEYKKRVYYAYNRINSIPKMSVMAPRGTFYLFINIKKTGLSSSGVCEALLKEAHILALPGTAFGDCGEGYIRIACTVKEEKMKEAFDRIERMQIFK